MAICSCYMHGSENASVGSDAAEAGSGMADASSDMADVGLEIADAGLVGLSGRSCAPILNALNKYLFPKSLMTNNSLVRYLCLNNYERPKRPG